MSTTDEIFAAVNALPASDRLALVTRIWETLPPEAWTAPDASELKEIQRRSAEFDDGGMAVVSKDEVRRRIRDCLNPNG